MNPQDTSPVPEQGKPTSPLPAPSTAGSLAATRVHPSRQVTLKRPGGESDETVLDGAGTGRYAVDEELGRGGMGIVVSAADRDLRRLVALKAMLGEQDPTRFLCEAQLTAQLEHPNIVPVHDLGLTAGGQLFFTMKLVGGRTFRDTLRQSPEQTRAMLEILLKVCDAIAFAHSRGVVHRDLKPENIMVGEFGEVLVMDWGLAAVRVLGRLGMEEAVEPLAGMMEVIWEHSLAIECGWALCNTRSARAHPVLVAARDRLGINSGAWGAITRLFARLPEPAGEEEPSCATGYNNRGLARCDRGAFDGAIEDFTRAIDEGASEGCG